MQLLCFFFIANQFILIYCDLVLQNFEFEFINFDYTSYANALNNYTSSLEFLQKIMGKK